MAALVVARARRRWWIGVFRAVVHPFERLLRSVDQDALRLERLDNADTQFRDADAGSLPDLSEFVTTHYPRLIRLAGLITRNTDDAEDAVQAALERAWKRRDALRDQGLLKQWIDRIVVREASRISGSRVKRLSRLVTRTQDDEMELDVPDRAAPVPSQIAEMGAAFRKLSVEQRAVVSLHLYAGYSVAETAQIVGAPLETVRSRLRLARQRLRNELEPPQ